MIPTPAWEQAVFVVLFVVFVILWIREDVKRRKAEAERDRMMRQHEIAIQAQADQRNRELMSFIERRDTEWQGFLRQTRDEDCTRHNGTTEILNKLADLMAEHDGFVHTRFDAMSTTLMDIHQATTNRRGRAA
jgi:hypothetical protein